VNDELQWTWKEAAVVFEVLSRQFPGGIQENHGMTSVRAASL
jgi:hypothetical protein